MRVKWRTAASAYLASNLSFNILLMVLGIKDVFPPRQHNVDSTVGRIHPSVVFSSRRISQIELAAEERFHLVPLLLDIDHQYFFFAISLRWNRHIWTSTKSLNSYRLALRWNPQRTIGAT